ncbi:MAG: hypothetical protein IPK72_03235 [Candidatus Eisenbacteria bacterium]|nr:hypothetical protein [Candidatus Eisenbacteria bacterium]
MRPPAILPRALLTFKQGPKTLTRMTDAQGKFVFDLPTPGDVEILCRAPYVWKSIDKPKARERVLKAERKFKTALIWPVPDDSGEHKQYVNLTPALDHPERGSKIKIKVGCATKDDGAPGEPVYFQAEFDAANSDRTPEPGGFAKGSVHTEEKPLDAKKQVEFELELGHAGGEKVTITIGGTASRSDIKFVIRTWRQLFYELMAPESMKALLPAKPLIDGKSGRELPGGVTAFTIPRLDAVFVKYDCLRALIFKTKDAPAGTIYEGAYVGSGAENIYALGRHTRLMTPRGVSFSATPDPRAIQLTLCDYLFKGDDPPAETYVETESPSVDIPAPDGAYFFPINMTNGSVALTLVGWEAVIDPVAYPAHPGVSGGDPRAEEGEAGWVEFVDWQTLRVTLPASDPLDPGSFVGPESDTTCPVRVWIGISLAGMLNGTAGGGAQAVVMSRPLSAVAVTIAHELGHSMGMTVAASAGSANQPPNGLPSPPEVAAGNSYSGHGHNGSHCADGVSDKTLAGFESVQGTCILFGAGGDEEPPARDQFCPTCQTYLRGRRLTDIRSRFSSRPDAEC